VAGRLRQKLSLLYNEAVPDIIVIIHNIRSTHNVGAIFRSCEGFGVSKIILSGYSPYPKLPNDSRLPHIYNKLTDQIHKSALGAEGMIPFEYQTMPDFAELKNQSYSIVGLEQDERSIMLPDFKAPAKLALLLGEEVKGITDDLRGVCNYLIEIPMKGQKESFNVSVAAGIALYQITVAN